jgi:alpha-tubulin suppressor-like RCC1 family protein
MLFHRSRLAPGRAVSTPMRRFSWVTRTKLLAGMLMAAADPGMAQSQVVGWGDTVVNSAWNQELFVEVAAGGTHTVARRSDGSVVVFGDNTYLQSTVPVLPSGLTYVEVAAGGEHTVARRSDGSVVAFGDNLWGQCNVPPLPGGLTYVEVSAGDEHSLARRSNGSIVGWGSNTQGQLNVPALPGGLSYV